MKVTIQARTHRVTIPVAGRPSDWPVKDIEERARRVIKRHHGGKARILSLHADEYEIQAVIAIDEIDIDYEEELGAQ